jgi:hypothetical protein
MPTLAGVLTVQSDRAAAVAAVKKLHAVATGPRPSQRQRGGYGAASRKERAAELQDPEIQAELDRRVRGCERECSAGGRLGSIPQACARARQQATREQVKGQWCESRTGVVRRRCDQARRSCRRLLGCADRVSASHVREQRRLSP